MKTTIAVLLTCHNRKQKTLQCLKALFEANLPIDYGIEVFLVDDGSTDGTFEEISQFFPDVNLIKGTGNLYWNRGMRLIWEFAFEIKDFDFYLWLNDDTFLINNSLLSFVYYSEILFNESILVGTTCSLSNKSRLTYGGKSKGSELIHSKEVLLLCDHFNGNIVWIPQFVFKKIGFNDRIFHHALGDYDYGLRAKRHGINSFVVPGILGLCDEHFQLPVWCNPKISIVKRFKYFRSPLGHNPEEFFIFNLRHQGFFSALFHYFTNHLRVIFPFFWRNSTN